MFWLAKVRPHVLVIRLRNAYQTVPNWLPQLFPDLLSEPLICPNRAADVPFWNSHYTSALLATISSGSSRVRGFSSLTRALLLPQLAPGYVENMGYLYSSSCRRQVLI